MCGACRSRSRSLSVASVRISRLWARGQILGNSGSLPAHRPVPFLAELLACKAEEPQPFQKVSCAMKYAAAGLDVLSSIRGETRRVSVQAVQFIFGFGDTPIPQLRRLGKKW
eukprot:g25054.t1